MACPYPRREPLERHSLASRMRRTQWTREQARVTISGAASRRRRPGSCRARQQQSRPACRSTLSGICSWIRCQARACGGAHVRGGVREQEPRGPQASGPPRPRPPRGRAAFALLVSPEQLLPVLLPSARTRPGCCASPSGPAGSSRKPPGRTPGQALPADGAGLAPCGQGGRFEGMRSGERQTPEWLRPRWGTLRPAPSVT